MKQNTLVNSGETKYIKNTHKGNFIILNFFSILLNNNARLFNFIGQSFLLNNTKIFDIRQNGCTNRQNTLANSGEPEYIKNTRKGNLMTSNKVIKFSQDCSIFRTVFFIKKDLTSNFLSSII